MSPRSNGNPVPIVSKEKLSFDRCLKCTTDVDFSFLHHRARLFVLKFSLSHAFTIKFQLQFACYCCFDHFSFRFSIFFNDIDEIYERKKSKTFYLVFSIGEITKITKIKATKPTSNLFEIQ